MINYLKYILIIPLGVFLILLLTLYPSNEVYFRSNSVEYWAVIVGVADYQYFNPSPLFPKPVKGYDLLHPDDDANEIAARLGSIWGAEHIKLLINSQATKTSIQNAITGWLDSKEDANDVILFYFSGHGQREGNDEYTIWPYNTLAISDRNEIQDDMLNSWLRCLESKQQVIIIDSCNSGGFIEELYYYNRIILTSCSKNEDSYETSVLDHSIFTYFLLDAFNHLNSVDENNDNSLSIEEVFNWAKSKTFLSAKARRRTQNPKICDCYCGEIILINFERDNNLIRPYVIGFITIVIFISMMIKLDKNLSLERFREE